MCLSGGIRGGKSCAGAMRVGIDAYQVGSANAKRRATTGLAIHHRAGIDY